MSYMADYFKKRKEDGTCKCCKNPIANTSKTFCEEHLVQHRKQQAAYRSRVDAECKTAGICRTCKKPVSESSIVFCDEHLALHRGHSNPYTKHKARAKERGIEFTILPHQYAILMEDASQCYYCGVGVQTLKENRRRMVVDRKDNGGPYSVENMVVACNRCNVGKSNFFTAEEWKEIADKYIKPRLKEYQNLCS